MQKRVLLTGGAGFLGSNLAERLLRKGASVVILDNFLTGSQENVQPLREKYPGCLEIKECDVRNLTADDGPYDEIYNLACPASPPWYQRDPVRTLLTCVEGARNVLELARKCGAKVLQCSTSEVYGDAQVHPQTEGYWGNVNPCGLRSCYDEGKRAAESLFFDHHRMYGTRIKVIRIFNTYGPKMRANDGRVVSNFILQALRGEPLTLYGDGEQTRSFCYCTDLLEGMERMMASEESFLGPVNLGNPGEFTIRELAQLVLELTGSASPLRHLPLPANDPKVRRPDISLAREKLQWQPVIPLREGLPPTIDYFRNTLP